MAKNLIVNCATCDARTMQEENYAHYETIVINSAALLTSPDGKAVMSKLPVTLNCANVLEVARDVHLRAINGKHEIHDSDAVSPTPFYLVVNGVLTIHPHTQKQLEHCVGITVNGTLTCPESMYATLANVNVNGATTCYPDGAIVLKRSAVIDKVFTLRAKSSLYWSARRMIMVDPQLDGAALRSKGAFFHSKEVIVAQSKVEELVDLIDEQAQLILVPDHTAVVLDDVTLDETTVGRYGKKLYVIGDVTVPQQNAALEGLEYLNVQGDIKVPQEHKDQLLSVLTEVSGAVKVTQPRGTVVEDKPYVKITKWMLEQQPKGILVSDCAFVHIADDIPREWIMERLHIEDCAVVQCCEALEDAVAMVCEECAQVGHADHMDGGGIGDTIKAALGGIKGALDTKVINATQYVL